MCLTATDPPVRVNALQSADAVPIMFDYDKLSVRILEPFRQTDFLIWHSLDNKIATFWGFRKQNTDTFTDSPPPFEANLICGQKDEQENRIFLSLESFSGKKEFAVGDIPCQQRI